MSVLSNVLKRYDSLTPEQKKKVKKVQDLVASGSSVADAQKKIGVSHGWIYTLAERKKRTAPAAKKPKQVNIISMPMEASDNDSDNLTVCLLRGNNQHIREVMETIKGVWL